MFRTTAIALAAIASVGIASLASTAPAAAHGWHGHHHHHHHAHWHKPIVHVHVDCWQKVWVKTYHGGFWKTVNVCR
ncbi:hypothetical protein [Pseudorhodoplanes sp.]|uniref:hypothetical protein n=1 Tax=Pseudorhodoplanes sp. TaxID=1934341 RepID=UPI002B807011|nr:hypothetical protein [Pseudorhodoplanes sp.]HWV53510.1 hypothetical protein [Pseudorhodoplanes sp.]